MSLKKSQVRNSMHAYQYFLNYTNLCHVHSHIFLYDRFVNCYLKNHINNHLYLIDIKLFYILYTHLSNSNNFTEVSIFIKNMMLSHYINVTGILYTRYSLNTSKNEHLSFWFTLLLNSFSFPTFSSAFNHTI